MTAFLGWKIVECGPSPDYPGVLPLSGVDHTFFLGAKSARESLQERDRLPPQETGVLASDTVEPKVP